MGNEFGVGEEEKEYIPKSHWQLCSIDFFTYPPNICVDCRQSVILRSILNLRLHIQNKSLYRKILYSCHRKAYTNHLMLHTIVQYRFNILAANPFAILTLISKSSLTIENIRSLTNNMSTYV